MKIAKRLSMSLAAVGASILLFPTLANAAINTVVVTNNSVARQAEDSTPTKNWVLYTRNAATGQFLDGPAQPPLGKGSLELKTPTGADKITAFNFDHINTKLSDINAMSYSTYRSAGDAQQVAAINIQVDVNGDAPGGFTTLIFEPVYNTDQGAVVSGKWQNWDAFKNGQATWWSSRSIPAAPNQDTFVSWDTIKAANPNATILGGYGINQGSGNANLTTAVDALTIGTPSSKTTYDFEQKPVRALAKDDCKKDGYKEFQTQYKNQGECVSSVAKNQNKND